MAGPVGHGGGRGGRYLTEEEKAAAPKVTKELIVRIFSYLKPYWKQMLLVLAAILVSSIFTLAPSVLTGRIIDEGLIARDMEALIRLILLSLAVTFAANLIGVLESYLNTWIAQHITFDMRNKMYRHLQKMSQRFFTTNNQGDIITRMTSDIDGVQRTITNSGTTSTPSSASIQLRLNITARAAIRVMVLDRMEVNVLVITDWTPDISLVMRVMISPWLLAVKKRWLIFCR